MKKKNKDKPIELASSLHTVEASASTVKTTQELNTPTPENVEELFNKLLKEEGSPSSTNKDKEE